MVKKINEVVGIDKPITPDIIAGLVVGAIILLVGFLIPGISTIGIPSVPQSLSSFATSFIIIVLLASIFETFAFFDLIISFIEDKMSKFIGVKIPFILVAIITSIIFATFHLASYGSFASAGGSFVSAFIMGLVFSYERKLTNSNLPGIFTHMVLNFWIGFGSGLVIIG